MAHDRGFRNSVATGAVRLFLMLWVTNAPHAVHARDPGPTDLAINRLKSRAEAVIANVPTLELLSTQLFFQIPVAEQRRSTYPSDLYRVHYALPVARWLEENRSRLEAELQQRFSALTYDQIADRRARNLPIQYCAWIPAARVDGQLTTEQDFLRTFRRTCRTLAISTIERLALEKISQIDASLIGIRKLEDDLPRWMVADLARDADSDPPFDGLGFDRRYQAQFLTRIDALLGEMIVNLRQHFLSLPVPQFPLPHPAGLCREILGGAFRMAGFGQGAGEALRTRCVVEARDWAKRHEKAIAAALREAIQKDRATRPMTSAHLLCRDAFAAVLGDGALLDAVLRQSLAERCDEWGRDEEVWVINRHADRFLAAVEHQGSPLQALRQARWLVFAADQIRPFADPRAAMDLDFQRRVLDRLESRLKPARAALVVRLEREIEAVHGAANRSADAFDRARSLCTEIRVLASGAPLAATELAAKATSRCQREQETLFRNVVERALAGSGVNQLQGQIFVAGSTHLDPRAIVVASALSGRQVEFSRSWWRREGMIRVTSIFGGEARIEAKFQAGSTPLHLVVTAVDPIPGYSQDPNDVIACLFATSDSDQAIASQILASMRSLLDGMALALLHEVMRERCNQALRQFFRVP